MTHRLIRDNERFDYPVNILEFLSKLRSTVGFLKSSGFTNIKIYPQNGYYHLSYLRKETDAEISEREKANNKKWHNKYDEYLQNVAKKILELKNLGATSVEVHTLSRAEWLTKKIGK